MMKCTFVQRGTNECREENGRDGRTQRRPAKQSQTIDATGRHGASRAYSHRGNCISERETQDLLGKVKTDLQPTGSPVHRQPARVADYSLKRAESRFLSANGTDTSPPLKIAPGPSTHAAGRCPELLALPLPNLVVEHRNRKPGDLSPIGA